MHRCAAGIGLGVVWLVSTLGCDRDPSDSSQPSQPSRPSMPSSSRALRRGPVELPRVDAQSLHGVRVATTVRAQSALAAAPITDPIVDAKILVIGTNGQEAELAALQDALGHLGIPFDLLLAATSPLTADRLATGNHGKYNGVIITRGNLIFDTGAGAQSLFDPGEWDILQAYEAAFGVREASLYLLPDGGDGLSVGTAQDATVTPAMATCTTAGRSVFFDVNCDGPIAIRGVWAYPAAVRDPATTTALLVDGNGNALASTQQLAGGRETLELSFGHTRSALHTLQLIYGVVSWATRGLFLGERQIYFGTQVDDVFIQSDIFGTTTPFRITAADMKSVFDWQATRRSRPTTAGVRLDMALNAVGTVIYAPDPLAAEAQDVGSGFKWISHTYDHHELDASDYATMYQELSRNNARVAQLGLLPFSPLNLVTPSISGLTNPNVMQAAFDMGVRFVVTDTSAAGTTCGVPNATCGNPTPNAGFYNSLQPGILMIPRRPTNLFYDVSTPDEWTAQYNSMYRTYWGRDLTYQEMIGKESDVLLSYLLKGENDPWMFHQANLHDHGAGHSLLSDLLDATFDKYDALLGAPMVSPTMDELGGLVADRMRYNSSGASATIGPGKTLTVHVAQAARVPVTGACGDHPAAYAGQVIARVDVSPGADVTLPFGTNCSSTGGTGAGGSSGSGGAGGSGAGGSLGTGGAGGAGGDSGGAGGRLGEGGRRGVDGGTDAADARPDGSPVLSISGPSAAAGCACDTGGRPNTPATGFGVVFAIMGLGLTLAVVRRPRRGGGGQRNG